jgi:hypothetical protein
MRAIGHAYQATTGQIALARLIRFYGDIVAATPSGRPIVYNINPNSIHETGPLRDWGDVANMWRTSEDITNAWNTGQTNGFPIGIQNIVNVNAPLAHYVRPGGFNYPDMMEVGRGGMTDTEMRSHFALRAKRRHPTPQPAPGSRSGTAAAPPTSNGHSTAVSKPDYAFTRPRPVRQTQDLSCPLPIRDYTHILSLTLSSAARSGDPCGNPPWT